jgi:phosphomevalonate kinase
MSNNNLKIIALSAAARTGKDTIATILAKKIGNDLPHMRVAHLALAQPIKEDLHFLAQKFNIDINSNDPEEKKALRHLMVGYGTFCRAISEGKYFIEKILQKAEQNKLNVLIISDCRYLNEVDHFQEMGGKIVGLTREGVKYPNVDEKKLIPMIHQKADLLIKVETKKEPFEIINESERVSTIIFNKFAKYLVKN